MPTLEVILNEPVYVALKQATRLSRQTADAIVQDALDVFLRMTPQPARDANRTPFATAWRRAKIHAEAEAWRALPETVRRRYSSEFIAVHEGQVIDHDPDRVTLHLRVRERLGDTPVLITPADAPDPREFQMLSPRLERTR
jgi:hypothetical protein